MKAPETYPENSEDRQPTLETRVGRQRNVLPANISLPAITLVAVLISAFLLSHTVLAQGPLAPPGAPGPTFKTLQQVGPRTAISTNTAPGDADSQFKITQPGSYYLTANITGVTAKYGIEIATSGVVLDLMGFELAGVSGSFSGVYLNGDVSDIAIRNGTVRNWGARGVDAPSTFNCRFQDLRLSANGGSGLFGGENSAVVNCSAQNNGFYGIYAGSGSTISSCTAQTNIATGIVAGNGCTVQSCLGFANALSGIIVGEGCTVIGCTARGNGNSGINADFGSTVSSCTASANSGDGIRVSGSCRVVDNTCVGNGAGAGDGTGINATASRNRIDSNTVMGNDTGILCNPATANLIIRNSARGNTTTNYNILAGNNSGAIILSPGVGFSSSNPWANFEF